MTPSTTASLVTADKRMKFDDVAWDRSDNLFAEWKKKVFTEEVFRTIGRAIIKHRKGVPEELFNPIMGAFNLIFRMQFMDGGAAILRYPVSGAAVFSEEKIRREVSVMRFIECHTNIRVPHVFHYGMTGPADLGPFIVMEYIEHDSDLVDALNTPDLLSDDKPILDPNVSEESSNPYTVAWRMSYFS